MYISNSRSHISQSATAIQVIKVEIRDNSDMNVTPNPKNLHCEKSQCKKKYVINGNCLQF